MRSSAHIKGHPLHPMLIPFPFAYLFGSAVIDVWARATARDDWFRTSHHLNRLGLGTAVMAAVPGLIDYVFAVPPNSSGKERATRHMFANLSAVGLFAVAGMARREDQPPPVWALAVEAAGAGLLALGGWLGGTLVYRNQIAVDHRYANAGKYRVDALPPQEPETSNEVDVGGVDDLGVDQMKLLRVGGDRVVLARTEQGYVAFDDRCTHRGGPLSDGTLACETVQCPWHGSQYDVRTGTVKQGPATEGIQIYRVEVRDGRLWLERPRKEALTGAARQ